MLKPPRPLLQRSDVRLAVTAGLANALGSLSSVPFGYYAPLAVLAVCTGSYGGTLALGRQRILGSLLGTVVLLVGSLCLPDVPMPLALAIALGAQRLLGGALGLAVGYKVGGMIIVMGWLVHADQLSSWIPLRLLWTVVGILLAMLGLSLLWPQRILERSWSDWAELLDGLADAVANPMADKAAPGGHARQLRSRLSALRCLLPVLRVELGERAGSDPGYRLLLLLDGCCSRLIGLLEGLRRQAPRDRDHSDPCLVALVAGEAALLSASAERLRVWADFLRRRRPRRLPPAPPPLLNLPEAWRRAENQLGSLSLGAVPLERLERLAGRLQLCRQAERALRDTEVQWQLITLQHR